MLICSAVTFHFRAVALFLRRLVVSSGFLEKELAMCKPSVPIVPTWPKNKAEDISNYFTT
jgi:hypothetical protein